MFSLAEVRTRVYPGWCGEELPQIGVVKVRISIFVKLPLERVIGLELEVQAIVVSWAILRRIYWRLPGQRAHEFIHVFKFLQRPPLRVTLAPVQSRREPDREGLGEIFVGMALRIPVIQV